MVEEIWPVKGPQLDGWNPSEPLKAFQEFAEFIHNKAKEFLLRDGRHSEMLFFVPLSGRSHIVQWHGRNPDAKAVWMRTHIQDHYIYGVIHVSECWIRMANDPNDPLTQRIAAGEMRVSDLPRSERIEALLVLAQTRDGYSHTWVDEMVREGKNGTVSLGKTAQFDNIDGRFGNLFK